MSVGADLLQTALMACSVVVAPAPVRGTRIIRCCCGYDNVAGLQALGPLLHFELDLIAFVEALVAIAADRGEVAEDVAALFLLNETEALFIAEPFDSACCHSLPIFPALQHPAELQLSKRPEEPHYVTAV